MRKTTLILPLLVFASALSASSLKDSIPSEWMPLYPILIARVEQTNPKMKLNSEEASSFIEFLKTLKSPPSELIVLEKELPKTTLELLMAVHKRGLQLEEARKMASYLSKILKKFEFQNIKPFDENTSHIIGREWSEIDYSGENMTWQTQRKRYLPYGITDFKSEENLVKFFQVESRLPYFKKIYKPKNPDALSTKR